MISEEGLVDTYPMETDYEVGSGDIGDDIYTEESDFDIDCDDGVDASEMSITKQAKEQTRNFLSEYTIYADILK